MVQNRISAAGRQQGSEAQQGQLPAAGTAGGWRHHILHVMRDPVGTPVQGFNSANNEKKLRVDDDDGDDDDEQRRRHEIRSSGGM